MGSENDRGVLLASVEVLSETKSQAESRVKLVRSLLEDEEIDAAELRRLQLLYADSRSSVNAGLDRLLVELEIDRAAAPAESYAVTADRAAERVAAFIAASDALILGDDRGDPVTAVLDLVKSLPAALIDIWKTLRNDTSERRTRLIARIESLKWEPFDRVGSGAE